MLLLKCENKNCTANTNRAKENISRVNHITFNPNEFEQHSLSFGIKSIKNAAAAEDPSFSK